MRNTTSTQRTIQFREDGRVVLSVLAARLLEVCSGALIYIFETDNKRLLVGNNEPATDNIVSSFKLYSNVGTQLAGKSRKLCRYILSGCNTRSITYQLKIVPTKINGAKFHELINL